MVSGIGVLGYTVGTYGEWYWSVRIQMWEPMVNGIGVLGYTVGAYGEWYWGVKIDCGNPW